MNEEELDFMVEEEEGNLLAEFVLRWLPVMLVLAVLGGVLGYFYFRRLPKVYMSATTVLAEVKAHQVLDEVGERDANASNYSTVNTREFFATQMQVLRSRDLAERVFDRLKLGTNPTWRTSLGPGVLDDDKVRIRSISMLQEGLMVHRERHARVIKLSFQATDPTLVAEVVAAFAEEYVDKSSAQRTTAQKKAYLWLQAEESRLRAELVGVESEIREFRGSEGLLSADIENSRTLRWSSLSRLQEQADALGLRESSISERLKSLEGLDWEARAAALSETNEQQPLVNIQKKLTEIRANLANHNARYGGEHPVLVEGKKTMAALVADRNQMVTSTMEALTAELTTIRNRRAQVLASIQSGRGEVLRINTLAATSEQLHGHRAKLQKALASVADQLLTTGMAVRMTTNNVQILDHASVPIHPIGPNGKLILLAGLILGGMLGAGLGLVVELAQTTIGGPDQVRRLTRIPVVGMVDQLRRQSETPDLTVAQSPRSHLAEQFRSLRSNLLFMQVDHEMKSISVSSPSPKDGKTFNAVSIAVVMAQSGKRVLIIDTDLRRGRLHRVFDRENEKGVVDVLTRQATVEEAWQDTEVENLFLLSVGTHPPNPAELLHSGAFARMRDELLKNFDLLIFDTPPVNLVTDAVILANATDGMLLVVREGQTSKRDLSYCMERLRSARVRVIGCIFNGQRMKRGGYGYRYGGRRYGYYGSGGYGSNYSYKSYGIEES